MNPKIVALLVVVIGVERSFQFEYFHSSEEIRNPWSGERSLSSTTNNIKPGFFPRFQLQNIKDRDSSSENTNRNPTVGSDGQDEKQTVFSYSVEKNISENVLTESVFNIQSDRYLKNFTNVNDLQSINKFPMYFSNPKNGIVYYIDTLEGTNKTSGLIQKYSKEYITREEHNKQIEQLKQRYEGNCIKKDSNRKDTQNNKKTNRPTLEPGEIVKRKRAQRKKEHKLNSAELKEAENYDQRTPQNSPTESGVILTTTEQAEYIEVPLQRPMYQSPTSSSKKIISKRSITESKTKNNNAYQTKILQNTIPPNRKNEKLSKKNHLTTHIHVTSEYGNSPEKQDPQVTPPTKPAPMIKPLRSGSSKPCDDDETNKEIDYNSDDYSYLDFDYLSFGDYDDYSAEEDGGQSLENEQEDYNNNPVRLRRKKFLIKQKKNKKHRKKVESYDIDEPGIFDYITGIFTPIHQAFRRVITTAADLNLIDDYSDLPLTDEYRKPKRPKYNLSESYDRNSTEDSTNNWSWFNAWFGPDGEEEELSDVSPTQETPGWFNSWFDADDRTSTAQPIEDYEDEDKWFFGWFDTQPKKTRRPTKTTTTTPVPILTISDPMKNPQKWIGILAEHIVNSTASTTNLPNVIDDEPKKVSYEKYQIWRLKPTGEAQVKALEEYKNSEDGAKLQWLKGPSLRGLNDVLIPQKLLYDFQGTLNFEDISHEVLIFDLGKAILFEELKEKVDNTTVKSSRFPLTWRTYHRYDDIIRYVELLQMRNPNYIEVIHIGRSYEGKPLVVVQIGTKADRNTKKKTKLKDKNNKNSGVFIEAGAHGREWIGPASATWIINELVKIMKTNDTSNDFIKRTTWYVMPVLNPDGYEYSHEFDRMWRKSRSKHMPKRGILDSAMGWFKQPKPTKVCYGVDLDANWSYDWGQQGSSKAPCNEFFAGPSPLSEPETRALSKLLMDKRKEIKLFISLHAYGQTISFPNHFDTSYGSQKLDDLLDVAMVGIDGLRKSGSTARYKIDSTNDITRPKSGSLDYFAMHEIGIPFSYTIHLGDSGVHGFLLPASYIESTANDAFEIIKSMLDYIF